MGRRKSNWQPGVSTITPKFTIENADDMPISPAAYRLWAAFSRHNRDGLVPPSAKEMADKYSIGISMVRLAVSELEELGLIRRFAPSEEGIVAILSAKSPSCFSAPTGRACDWCNSDALTLEKHHYPVRKKDGGTDTCSICPSCHSEFHALVDTPRWEVSADFPWETFSLAIGGAA